MSSASTPSTARHSVLHVITGLNPGGAETNLYRLLQHVDRKRVRHVVVGLLGPGTIAGHLEELGVEVFVLDSPRGVPSPRATWELARIGTRLRPDVIHGWMYHGNLGAWFVHRVLHGRPRLLFGIRHTVHDMKDEKPLTRVIIRVGRWLAKGADCIVYNSHESARRHADLGYPIREVRVIPNGFDLDEFSPNEEEGRNWRRRYGLSPTDFVVGFFGRDHPIKGPDLLLEAAPVVLDDVQNASFVFVGRGLGPDRPAWACAARGESRIRFLGPTADMREALNGVDLVVSPSRSEAFSNVIGEALCCAVPVVATDVGDSRLVVGEAGVTVPPGQPTALADVILKLARMDGGERRALGRVGRCQMEKYSIGRVAREYEEFYGLGPTQSGGF